MEKRLDCGVFDPNEIAKVINEMAEKGTPMRHMQRRQVAAKVEDGKLIGNVER